MRTAPGKNKVVSLVESFVRILFVFFYKAVENKYFLCGDNISKRRGEMSYFCGRK